MRGMTVLKVSLSTFAGSALMTGTALAGGYPASGGSFITDPTSPVTDLAPINPYMSLNGGYGLDSLYQVELNKTQILRLPASASAVVIGNPNIADVSVHAADTLFIVGRGFGTTNLIILDGQGQTMMNSEIQVLNKPSSTGVRLFNGGARQTYNCSPDCQPSPILGDDPAFVGNFVNQGNPIRSSEALSALQPGAGTTSSPPPMQALSAQQGPRTQPQTPPQSQAQTQADSRPPARSVPQKVF